jgi:hypothetical protein
MCIRRRAEPGHGLFCPARSWTTTSRVSGRPPAEAVAVARGREGLILSANSGWTPQSARARSRRSRSEAIFYSNTVMNGPWLLSYAAALMLYPIQGGKLGEVVAFKKQSVGDMEKSGAGGCGGGGTRAADEHAGSRTIPRREAPGSNETATPSKISM